MLSLMAIGWDHSGRQLIDTVERCLLYYLRTSPTAWIVAPRRAVRIIEFAFVGGIGVVVNMLVFLGALSVDLHFAIAGFIAFVIAVQCNFVGHWLLTFSDVSGQLVERYVKFHAVSVGGLLVYQVVLGVALGVGSFPPAIANLCAILVGAVWNYTGFEQFAFLPTG